MFDSFSHALSPFRIPYSQEILDKQREMSAHLEARIRTLEDQQAKDSHKSRKANASAATRNRAVSLGTPGTR
jgi:hypothetical protein